MRRPSAVIGVKLEALAATADVWRAWTWAQGRSVGIQEGSLLHRGTCAVSP